MRVHQMHESHHAGSEKLHLSDGSRTECHRERSAVPQFRAYDGAAVACDHISAQETVRLEQRQSFEGKPFRTCRAYEHRRGSVYGYGYRSHPDPERVYVHWQQGFCELQKPPVYPHPRQRFLYRSVIGISAVSSLMQALARCVDHNRCPIFQWQPVPSFRRNLTRGRPACYQHDANTNISGNG